MLKELICEARYIRNMVADEVNKMTPGPWGHHDDVNTHLVTAGTDENGCYIYIVDPMGDNELSDIKGIITMRNTYMMPIERLLCNIECAVSIDDKGQVSERFPKVSTQIIVDNLTTLRLIAKGWGIECPEGAGKLDWLHDPRKLVGVEPLDESVSKQFYDKYGKQHH